MPWYDLIWTGENEEHIFEHGISKDEVENPKGHGISRSSRRRITYGETPDGRRIAVVYELVDKITVLPITAYEL